MVASAKATLLQVQNMLATQSDEDASRLRDAQIFFITMRRIKFIRVSESPTDEIVLPRELLLVRDIPSRKPPFVVAHGVMMTRGQSERADFN